MDKNKLSKPWYAVDFWQWCSVFDKETWLESMKELIRGESIKTSRSDHGDVEPLDVYLSRERRKRFKTFF